MIGGYLPTTARRRAAQRTFDLIVVAVGAVLWVPVMLVAAALVRIDSPGPVFFKQVRVGLHRQLFEIWKFRKMRDDLPSQGPMLTMRYDNRMTRVGRLLERTKLDELPQVFNVINGTMSLVGPRPDVPRFVEHHSALWDRVLSVRPGIFGASQNHFRNESELYPIDVADIEGYYIEHILPEMLRLDGDYVEHASLRRDLALLFGGVTRSLFGSVSIRAFSARWLHTVSALVIGVLGGLSMAIALTMQDLAIPPYTVVCGAIAALVAALVSAVPASSMGSFTTDDARRLLLAAAMRSGMVTVALMLVDRDRIGTATLVADGGLFLGGLFGVRLLAHLCAVHDVGPRSGSLRSRMVWYSAFVAPVTTSVVLTWRHGFAVWSGDDLGWFAAAVCASFVVRPAFLLLTRPVAPRADSQARLTAELAGLALAVVAGSGFLLLVSGVGEDHGTDVADALLDGLAFGGVMLAVGVWQASRVATAFGPSTTVRRRVVIVGEGPLLASQIAAFDALRRRRFDIVAVASVRPGQYGTLVAGHRIVGSAGGLAEIARTSPFDDLVVLVDSMTNEEVSAMRSSAESLGCGLLLFSLTNDPEHLEQS